MARQGCGLTSWLSINAHHSIYCDATAPSSSKDATYDMGPIADVSHSLPFRLDRVRPAFRESQRRCREKPPRARAARIAPWLVSIQCMRRSAGWDLVRLRVDEQRFADIQPSERDIFAVRLDVLSLEVAGISSFGKRRLRTGDRCVGKFGIEHALYSRLQPARHRDVVGMDAPAPFCQLAPQIEDMAGPTGEKIIRQWLASVEFRSPSFNLRRTNGFSPVRMILLGRQCSGNWSPFNVSGIVPV